MKSRALKEFLYQLNALPPEIQEQAKEAFARWHEDTTAPGLFFKHVKGTPDWWSVRIGSKYRAICIKGKTQYTWFFIGNHEDYESIIP